MFNPLARTAPHGTFIRRLWLLTMLCSLSASCAVVFHMRQGLPSPTQALKMVDARPPEDSERMLRLSGVVEDCGYGIQRLGDEQTVPSKMTWLQGALEQGLPPVVRSDSLRVKHFALYFNTQAQSRPAGRDQRWKQTGIVGGAILEAWYGDDCWAGLKEHGGVGVPGPSAAAHMVAELELELGVVAVGLRHEVVAEGDSAHLRDAAERALQGVIQGALSELQPPPSHPAASVTAAVETRRRFLRRCFPEGLDTPLPMNLTIRGDGRLSMLRVANVTEAQRECLSESLRGLRMRPITTPEQVVSISLAPWSVPKVVGGQAEESEAQNLH